MQTATLSSNRKGRMFNLKIRTQVVTSIHTHTHTYTSEETHVCTIFVGGSSCRYIQGLNETYPNTESYIMNMHVE